MKILTTLFFTLNFFFVHAQTIEFNIKGAIINPERARYAYLSTLSQQVPMSSDKVFMVVPIINGKFEFTGKFDLQGKYYQNACVFIDSRGNISKEELASKFKQLIWVTGRENNLRRIILENMKLQITKPNEMIISKVVEGGILTRQSDERDFAIAEGNQKLLDFVKKHPDSPISFDVVKEIDEMIIPENRDKLESAWGSPLKMYESLSNRLKHSKRGIALKKKIDAKY